MLTWIGFHFLTPMISFFQLILMHQKILEGICLMFEFPWQKKCLFPFPNISSRGINMHVYISPHWENPSILQYVLYNLQWPTIPIHT